MKVVIAGGSGFLGRALARNLAADGHAVIVLSRRPDPGPPIRRRQGYGEPAEASRRRERDAKADESVSQAIQSVQWTPDGTAGPWASAVDGAAAVVNLAGESIAARRWSAAQKTRIRESRVLATRSLVAAIAKAAQPPAVLVSGSAVGFYGPRDGEPVTEGTAAGHDFLAEVCVAWEAEARAVASSSRLVLVRTGLVLDRNEGALPQMLPPFKLFAGGPVGSGRQYWPWIHRDDWVGIVRHAIDRADLSGPVNATAPSPVTNADFARALGGALHRPSWLPAPAFALRIALGEMADGLLLSGQRAMPSRALVTGYRFKFEDVREALRAIFQPSR